MTGKPGSPFWQRLDIIQQSQLGPRHRMLLVALWRFLGNDGQAFPKQPALARAVGVSVRQLQRMLAELRDIVTVERTDNRTRYTVDWPAVEAGAVACKLPRCDTRVAPAPRRPCRTADDTRDTPDRTPVSPPSFKEAQPKNNQKPAPPRQPAAGLETAIPAGLNSADFRAAWAEWLAYRRERRLGVQPMTINRQLRKLAAIGPEAAAACIETSITNGWQGLFPDQQRTAPGHAGRNRLAALERYAARDAEPGGCEMIDVQSFHESAE